MSHIAVLDIGKTNKKILVYDGNLRLLDQVNASFPADESGAVHIERIGEQTAWILKQMSDLARRFRIRAISTTSHGATFVGVAASGAPALPVIAYTTEPGDDFRRRFSEQCGDPADLYLRLSTPNLGALVCLGRGIAFARERFPGEFLDVRTLLGLPQYFGHWLTGKAAAECTYMACHSYLWDFRKRDWSFVVDRLGIRGLLPSRVGRPSDVLGTVSPEIAASTGLHPDVLVTCGIHDSNASLLPFLIQEDSAFALNSTGTWSVAMVPTGSTSLTPEERARGAFLNCDAFGNPVKTAIFMCGGEHDAWWDAIRKGGGASGYPPFDPSVTSAVLEAAELFLFPGVMPGSGPFPESRSRLRVNQRVVGLEKIAGGSGVPAEAADPARAYAALNASLAVQTCELLKGVGVEDGMPIYVEGGFRRNDAYCALLASLFPASKILRTNLGEATALGAALTGLAALTRRDLKSLRAEFEIDAAPVEQKPLPGMRRYREAYLERVCEA